MTNNLFKRAACFTDLHVGLKHNSRKHNNDCVDFIDWFISEAKKQNAETCFFLGDFHHHRATINVSSLNYTMHILAKLNDAFENVYFIVGNHDLYYKEKRELNSIPMARLYPNIHLIDEITNIDNVAIIPWLVGDEWKKVSSIKSKYMFGHFEFPKFRMNAQVEMPDHGQISPSDFTHQEYIFSGHFHKRQQQGIIHYIGNPFGHNYADTWDNNRGAMFLEWGGVPKYINWEEGPRYIQASLSSLLEDPDKHLVPKTYAKIDLDVNLSYEDANFLRELLFDNYNIRELKLLPHNEIADDMQEVGNIKFITVDQIVTQSIKTMDQKSFNVDKLIEIYTDLQGDKN